MIIATFTQIPVLTALLDQYEVEALEEKDDVVTVFFKEGVDTDLSLKELQEEYSFLGFTYVLEEVEKVNWNEEWEKNYDPIIVDNKCLVRAT